MVIQIRPHTAADFAQLVPLFGSFFTWHRRLLGKSQPLDDAEAAEIAAAAEIATASLN
jgi:hypothetical protein